MSSNRIIVTTSPPIIYLSSLPPHMTYLTLLLCISPYLPHSPPPIISLPTSLSSSYHLPTFLTLLLLLSPYLPHSPPPIISLHACMTSDDAKAGVESRGGVVPGTWRPQRPPTARSSAAGGSHHRIDDYCFYYDYYYCRQRHRQQQ